MKKLFILLFITTLFIGCANDDNAPQDPIIPGSIKITITSPSNTLDAKLDAEFSYSPPDEAIFLRLFIFNQPIKESNGQIINDSVELIAGSDTNKEMTRNGITMNKTKNFGINDFTEALDLVNDQTYYWAILGYDADGNMVASSPSWSFKKIN